MGRRGLTSREGGPSERVAVALREAAPIGPECGRMAGAGRASTRTGPHSPQLSEEVPRSPACSKRRAGGGCCGGCGRLGPPPSLGSVGGGAGGAPPLWPRSGFLFFFFLAMTEANRTQ